MRSSAVILFSVALLACEPARVPINISIRPIDQNNNPLVGVNIFYDGNIVGTSDSSGHWRGQVLALIGSSHVLRAAKTDELFYYGSFSQTLTASEEMDRSVFLTPKLFAIEKKASIPKNDEASVSTDVVPAAVPESVSQALGANIRPMLITAGALLDKVEAVALPIQETPRTYALTIYTFVGDRTLSDVDLRVAGEYQTEQYCRSNQSGRCVLRSNVPWTGQSLEVIARHSGMKSHLAVVDVIDEKPIQLEMHHGKSFDVRAVMDSFGSSIGIAGVPVSIDGRKLGVTSKGGYYFHSLSAESSEFLEVSLEHDDLLPQRRVVAYNDLAKLNILRFAPRSPIVPTLFVEAIKVNRSKFDAVASELAIAKLSSAAIQERLVRDPYFRVADREHAQFILSPDIVVGEDLVLRWKLRHRNQLAVIDLASKSFSADKADPEVNSLVSEFMTKVPFQGSVIDTDEKGVILNLGGSYHHRINAGSAVDLYSVLNPAQILSRLSIKEVWDKLSIAKSDSAAAIGDVVRFGPGPNEQLAVAGDAAVKFIVRAKPESAVIMNRVSRAEVAQNTPVIFGQSETEMILDVQSPGFQSAVVRVMRHDVAQPGRGVVEVDLRPSRISVADAALKSKDLTAAETNLRSIAKQDQDYLKAQLMLASMYLEDLGLAERSIEILDRMIESSVEFQLNPREIFMLELNRAVVWLRMIQDNPNGSQELIADAVEAFDRLRTRGDSLELTIDVSHLLTYSRALCADIEAKLKTQNLEQAKGLWKNYLEMFAEQIRFSSYVDEAKSRILALNIDQAKQNHTR